MEISLVKIGFLSFNHAVPSRNIESWMREHSCLFRGMDMGKLEWELGGHRVDNRIFCQKKKNQMKNASLLKTEVVDGETSDEESFLFYTGKIRMMLL